MIRSERIRQTGTANIKLDIEVMKNFVSRIPDNDGLAFEDDFDQLFGAREDLKSDRNDKLKALMFVAAMALMNVDDLLGQEKVELVPFVTAIVKDPDFVSPKQKQTSSSTQYGPLQVVAIILFGSCLDENVSHVGNF